MKFRDLRPQYEYIKDEIDANIQSVINQTDFIGGQMITDLELKLAEYVGKKHCITCANGTDALRLALMAWGIGDGDAVFVPDLTFFSSGEVIAAVGATPIFVDVDEETLNVDIASLEKMIEKILSEGKLKPRVIVAVDFSGQPADYPEIEKIAKKYGLFILEDGAQGFGGRIGAKQACSFGDISTTSFFPAKPLGCYGDGGAVFTDNDEWAEIINSLKVHGKGSSKYDNVRIGINSRLDTIQAGVLLAKLPVFTGEELEKAQIIAGWYTELLSDTVITPVIKENYYSSWAMYVIRLKTKEQRDGLQAKLKESDIPTIVHYPKPLHRQKAFAYIEAKDEDYIVTNKLCDTILSLPFNPYLTREEVETVTKAIKEYMNE